MNRVDKSFNFDFTDDRDYAFTDRVSTSELPSGVSLIRFGRNVEHQLNLNSCVANASVSCLEILFQRANINIDLSRLFHYYNLRQPYESMRDKDSGAFTRDGFKIASKLGICDESLWPYDTNKVNTKPPADVYDEAKNHLVSEYRKILDNDIYMVKSAIYRGYPVLIGMVIQHSFTMVGKDGVYNPNGREIGGHAMAIVGYNKDGFIVENSWGSSWGRDGYFTLRYDVFQDAVRDAWVCTGIKSLDMNNLSKPDIIDPTIVLENNERQEKSKDKNQLYLVIGIIILVILFLAIK